MRTNQVHRLPVIDAGGRIVGILSLTDLAQEAGRETGTRKRAITFGAVGETLAAVCRPRSAGTIDVAA
jgi:CBS-domain-containing membrane protein